MDGWMDGIGWMDKLFNAKIDKYLDMDR